MGKKSKSGGGGEKGKAAAAREFVLKVAMHCRCNGCIDKIRNAVKELPLVDGVERVDKSALEAKGEVILLATADPEKLQDRLHRATGKKVDLLLPKAEAKPAAKKADLTAADAAQALLLNHLNGLPAQYGGQGAWGNQLLAPGAGYGAAQAYPWAVQPAEAAYPYPYPFSSHPAWGPYAYPPPAQGHGGAPAWHTYGYYN